MKFLIRHLSLWLLTCACLVSRADAFGSHIDSTSKTFLRQQAEFFKNASFERTAYLDIQPDLSDWHIQAAVMVGKTTNENELGAYFFPFGNNTLTAASGNDFTATVNPGILRDFDTSNLNVYSDGSTNFHSTLRLAPQARYFGVGLFASKALVVNDQTTKWKVEIAAPLMHIVNSTGLCEKVETPILTPVATGLEGTPSCLTMTEAFSQSGLRNGRILPSKTHMKKTGIADVELNFVYTSTFSDHCITETFGGLIIPTGNKPGDPKSEYQGCLFEPVVGNNHHFGVNWGNNFIVRLSENDERRISCTLSMNTSYLFPNKQYRTFDLKDKSFSRYLSVWPNLANMNAATDEIHQGGIAANYLTLLSRVAPRFSFQMTSALNYTQDAFTGSLGYTVISRQAEHIDLEQDLAPIAIKGMPSAGGTPYVSLARTVSNRYVDSNLDGTAGSNYAFAQITADRIDKNSGAAPACLAGAISASAGYQFDYNDNHAVVGLGGSYRFASNNAMPECWTAWMTGHIDF